MYMNVILYTVPHTGTNFVGKFLNTLRIPENKLRYGLGPTNTSYSGYIRIHATQLDDIAIVSQYHLAQLRLLTSSKPTIITARDPYLSAIRYIKPGEHRKMSLLKKRWDRFFKTIPTLNHHIIDIGIQEENRYTHLCDAADFLKVKYSEQKIKTFADAWKPENETTSDAKTKYIETGKLPEFYDWSLLDEAVAWYRNLPTNAYN